MLHALYAAKCRDLQISHNNKEQENRFMQYCQKTIKNRKIQMNEAGLGPESANVIGQILASKVPIEVEDSFDGEGRTVVEMHTFAHLDLGKNNLGNTGMANLLKNVMRCDSLVSLDLGSNDIMLDGASHLFRTLKRHASLSVLTIANHDRLHRNRIGINACADLRDYLDENRVISSLNIADNRIGNDGLAVIAPALNRDCVLCIFNLSNNDVVKQSQPTHPTANSQ